MKKPILTAILIILALLVLAGGIYAAVRLCSPEEKAPSTSGILEVRDSGGEINTYTLTIEDTVAVYNLLNDPAWRKEAYAEYIPSHILTIGETKYLFELGGYFYSGFNIIYEDEEGTVNTGRTQKDDTMLRQIMEIFAKYE